MILFINVFFHVLSNFVCLSQHVYFSMTNYLHIYFLSFFFLLLLPMLMLSTSMSFFGSNKSNWVWKCLLSCTRQMKFYYCRTISARKSLYPYVWWVLQLECLCFILTTFLSIDRIRMTTSVRYSFVFQTTGRSNQR